MALDFSTKVTEAQPFVGIRVQTTMAEVAEEMGQLLGEVFGYVQRKGVAPAGMPFTIYHSMEGDDLDIDWWPSAAFDEWATVPYTPTSIKTDDEWHSGVRPIFKFVGEEPHAIWHYAVVDSQLPGGYVYRARYAAGEAGTYDFWPDKTDDIKGFGSNPIPEESRFYAWPDVAVVPESEQFVYTLVHQRTGGGDTYDVWYLSQDESFWAFLPGVLRNH